MSYKQLRQRLSFFCFGILCCMCMGFHCNDSHNNDIFYYTTTPNRPSGPSSGQINVDITFTTTGSHTNDGNLVEYSFDFGDGYLSAWSTSLSAIHRYDAIGTYRVDVQARSERNHYLSSWSDYLEITITTRVTLHALWKDRQGSIWAVGDNGTIVCRDMEGYEHLQQIASQNLYSVWGEEQMFCCGSDGVVFQLLQGQWQRCQTNVDANLRRIFGAGKIIFAVGERGTIVRHSNNRWRREKTATKANLYALWVESENSAFAAGERGTVLYFNGINWKPMEVPCQKTLYGICGTSYRNLWAIGEQGIILHFDGASWQIVSSPVNLTLKGVYTPNGFELYVVGEGGKLLKRSAGKWLDISPVSEENLEAVFPRGREIFFAGEKMTFGRVSE